MFFSKARLSGDERAALTAVLGYQPDVLVVAHGRQSVAAVTREVLAICQGGDWQAIRWMDIQRGGWDSEAKKLHWELVDGRSGHLVLTAAGELPVVFAERVRASIVAQRSVTLPGELGSALLVARRQPGSDGEISWQAQGLGRCDLNDPEVQAGVLDAMEEFRAEFE